MDLYVGVLVDGMDTPFDICISVCIVLIGASVRYFVCLCCSGCDFCC